jgi:hypothetical protein
MDTVMFQTTDRRFFPLGEQATLVAENLRLFACGKFPDDVKLAADLGSRTDWTAGALTLANTIEETLTDARGGPIPLDDEATAEALFGALRLITNPTREVSTLSQRLASQLGH